MLKEGIVFNGFDTREYGMRLTGRSAPTPDEKEKKESVPFAHGSYDFSAILGERLFENRPLTYTFVVPMRDYDRRKYSQTTLENKLMRGQIGILTDTHAPDYYYRGKCVSVSTTDNWEEMKLDITVEFDCYPFKISEQPEGDILWDSFNFELDTLQPVEFNIDGSETIELINPGTPSVSPEVTASSEMAIQSGNQLFTFPAGTNTNRSLRLQTGENTLTITGNGTIKFTFRKEMI